MAAVRRQLEVPNSVAAELAGSQDAVLKRIEEQLACEVFLRGNVVTLQGPAEAVEQGIVMVRELSELVESGHDLTPETIESVTGVLARHESPSKVLEDTVWRHRNTTVAPKTVNQKRYVDAIRNNTVTFGIGPAGTGKTFLAVAMAAAALSRREVNRIILTRPAVEAGERLGFLPGDLMAKIDPYLRPLFDALHDMLDPEKVAQHLSRGVIEVAPLAFMRGRAQPLDQPVLTPTGFRPIGALRVGDLVVGRDGAPTPVLGVFPQGVREVYRVRAQDGAQTVCCAEHLWRVSTPSDQCQGKPGRVLETREMVDQLRRAHQHRFRLPLLSGPAEFEPRDVPLDPYAIGRLLGDGCLTTTTTPTFATNDLEPATSLEDPGGVIVANPVKAAMRELGLARTRSSTKFIPEDYLLNSARIRIAVLQGLLDSEGGAVRQRGRTCRIQYTTRSERLRDDVTFLVQSLGGVVYSRIRKAEGRAPGRARGRSVHHRTDAYILDIRLPAEIEPFRLTRKRRRYGKSGGGRPMRFVHSIEPAGTAETVCIQVGAADSLYVTDDFLVTHNTLNDSFIILDEAQNTSPAQMKMFLTRLGFNSKVVVTGDVTQIDLPRDERSGLVVVSEILSKVEGIEFIRFDGTDVVRHKLVQRIVEAYGEHAEQVTPELRPAERRRA